ncbi:conserved Plasmodium protein, unknown function [Plasmodium knowlesi strain H]|uniref:Uncharacterized protein n=3 Tax=Plasmodium knowlesi TaxID=5850 RepID=A0A5K1UV68_PLAKH|nr:conserved Plasmodium protein, unknown function [Plasmodium knowlesi strain H]OTN65198.1 Uncharacterized protein PKNOH_S120127800 [Plasmodium knowlesi]CAA9988141.1 conserved Plasmodium protein, unknown function [Plasmodium knowlesi strain H]SBO20035.1 conserved Plasmodium protein, unknown function [Plasmodium knowlesi strain H]SBO20794.1 conserved Plasmodium protein, unknown function [Plasmodium knowlesi strain H]VVS77615.1 conserved Plasmodium protein, unknown function [Plasmodium knowlesi |eukprot:XP_002259117.1 hypothetical protein, conserved in Plasmodium species [Plasmodium knowlesi strain H]
MYFNGNEKGINNNGLIYSSVEKVHIADLREAATENGGQIDYLHFLSKKKRLNKLERLINNHVVNTQVVVTNFADDADEVINYEYMHQSVWRNKICFLLRNVYLSSFFSNEYANNIVKEHQPRVISINCKYDNQIYMSGRCVYLCVNDLTKLRLTSHRNVHRDRFKVKNIVLLDICSGGKTKPRGGKSGEAGNGKAPNGDAGNGVFPGGQSSNGGSKLLEKYRQFFTDMYTYPVDLVGLYNYGTDHEKFSEKLKNVLTLNGSKDAEIYAVPVKWHECTYDASGKNAASKTTRGDGQLSNPLFSMDQNCNSPNNEMDRLSDTFNMDNVANIYSSIFSNSSVKGAGTHVNSLINMYNMYGGEGGGLDVMVHPNDAIHNEFPQGGGIKPVGMINQFNYLDIQRREKIGQVHPVYELDAGYIEREFLSDLTQDGKIIRQGNNTCGAQHIDAKYSMPRKENDMVDLHDLLARSKENKKKKTFSLHDKRFYINYDSGNSSDVSLSEMLRINCGGSNNTAEKRHTDGSALKSSTEEGILKNYLKGNHIKEKNFANGGEDTREEGRENCIESEIDEKKKKSLIEKRRMEGNSAKNDHAAVDEAKMRKIDKVLDLLKNHRNTYYKVNERVLQRERLYNIMSCASEEDATGGISNGIACGNNEEYSSDTKTKHEKIANYLVEYIGRIHLDVKINHQKNAHMFIKKEKNFYQVQKIILRNGIISSCCIRDTCNFLIGQLVNRKGGRERCKLCYVVSFWGECSTFIHFDKPSQEICSQTCIHLFFFCSPETIYITMLNTQDRVF